MSVQVLANISHILFDLDGLLIDTETSYVNAYHNVTKRYGKSFTWELKIECMDSSAHWTRHSTNKLIQRLALPLSAQQLEEEAYKEFLSVVKEVDLMPGAERLVRHLHRHNIPMAIATGSDRKHFDLKISKHSDFFHKHFAHHVLASEDPDIKRGKPCPDIFEVAAKKFGPDIKPENVLVFEDTQPGVESALAAQMHCVWVPDSRSPRSQLKVTQVINSLEEFEPLLYGLPAFD